MSRIVAAWEMGANMGHIDRMLMWARAMHARGHEVLFALRDLSRAQGRVAAEGFAILQAPLWLPRLAHPPRLGNYAAVLATAGWLDPAGLAGLLSAWRGLFSLAQADAVVCDHAPTALLAARCAGLRSWAIGNSFEVPPPGPHFPSMQAGDAADTARCPQYDAALLAPANQALALLGQPPLERLTDLFDGRVHKALASVPELGHYDGYPAGVEWVGPCFVGDAGVVPQWPAGSGPRAFVYLSPSHPGFRPLMQALHEAGLVALVHAKGLSADAATRLGGDGRIRFEPVPVQMHAAAAQADLVVSHASLGTATAALLAGKPQLVLPSHTEQAMVARCLVRHGVGLALPVRADGAPPAGQPAPPPLQPAPLLRRLLNEPDFQARARALAARHAGADPARTGERLADLIEASLQAAPPETTR